MGDKENLIVRYARMYELELKNKNYDDNEVEKLLNEWIKKALEYLKENPNVTKEELDGYLKETNKCIK